MDTSISTSWQGFKSLSERRSWSLVFLESLLSYHYTKALVLDCHWDSQWWHSRQNCRCCWWWPRWRRPQRSSGWGRWPRQSWASWWSCCAVEAYPGTWDGRIAWSYHQWASEILWAEPQRQSNLNLKCIFIANFELATIFNFGCPIVVTKMKLESGGRSWFMGLYCWNLFSGLLLHGSTTG